MPYMAIRQATCCHCGEKINVHFNLVGDEAYPEITGIRPGWNYKYQKVDRNVKLLVKWWKDNLPWLR